MTRHQRNGPIQVTGVGARVVAILGDAIPSHDTITTITGAAVPGEATATIAEVVLAATPVVEVRTTTSAVVGAVTTTPEVGVPRNADADSNADVGNHSTVSSH